MLIPPELIQRSKEAQKSLHFISSPFVHSDGNWYFWWAEFDEWCGPYDNKQKADEVYRNKIQYDALP